MSAPPKSAGADHIDVYLDALFGRARAPTLVELRWRASRGMGQRFVPAGELSRARAVIEEMAPVTDVYVGVLPRWRRAGGRAAVVGDCRTVWVDLDVATAMRALEPVEPEPNVVVASGAPGHVHAYWRLRRAVTPSEVEWANRRLAWALGGDLSSADAARILRPPGTVNHRRGGATVQLRSDPRSEACRLGDLVGGLIDPPMSRRPPLRLTPRRHPSGDRVREVSPERYVLALTGRPVGRDRKVSCPLHEDRTPSLHVYEDPSQGWYCFGCRRGGTVYDLAAALWNVEPRGRGMADLHEALSRLL